MRNPWEGEEDAERLAELAHRKVQHKHDLLVQALEGQMRPHHRFLLHELLGLIEALDRSIVHVEQEIAHRLRPFDEPLPRLEAITGVSRRILEVLFAEVGWDMSRFPDAAHLASWAAMMRCITHLSIPGAARKNSKGSSWVTG